MPQILGWAAHRREEKVTSPFKGQIAAITVPLVAPSCNHYVKHTRKGRHYVTSEATAFKEALRLYARRQTVRGKAYKVEIWVHLGKGQKGDIDNYAKCCLDGLKDARVIDTDAKVENLHLYKRRDPANPRTELVVEAIE
jgi:crossover junction endodeoxyribonuclease RusA